LYRRLNATPPGWSWLLVVLAGPLLLLTVYLGQMSGVSFAAYAAGLALLKRRPASAGICFAAMAIKPHLALLAIPALAGAAPAASVAFLLGLLIWPIGSVVVRGLSGMKEYILLLLRIHDGSAGLVTVRLSGLLPVSGAVFTLLQAVFGGLLVVFLVVLWLRCQLGRRTLGPGAVDAATAVALVALPWAVLYDLQFAATALLRLGYRGGPAVVHRMDRLVDVSVVRAVVPPLRPGRHCGPSTPGPGCNAFGAGPFPERAVRGRWRPVVFVSRQKREGVKAAETVSSARARAALFAILLAFAAFWSVLVIRSNGIFAGSFSVDFRSFWAADQAFITSGPASAYDLGRANVLIQQLSRYNGPGGGSLEAAPAPYPPPFFLIFAPFALLPPPIGLGLWTLFNLGLAVGAVWPLLRTARTPWLALMAALLFFPLAFLALRRSTERHPALRPRAGVSLTAA